MEVAGKRGRLCVYQGKLEAKSGTRQKMTDELCDNRVMKDGGCKVCKTLRSVEIGWIVMATYTRTAMMDTQYMVICSANYPVEAGCIRKGRNMILPNICLPSCLNGWLMIKSPRNVRYVTQAA